jgi:hypothetical protein
MLNYYKMSTSWFNVKNPKNTDGKDFDGKHEINRAWQVNQPLFDGTNRWKKELNSTQIDDIVDSVGEVASFFGYKIQ